MVAGGPVVLGGLQPYVFGVQHSMVDLHGWAMLLGHRWARLTGWPVAMVAGGPDDLGGLQPYFIVKQSGVPCQGWTRMRGYRWTSRLGGL